LNQVARDRVGLESNNGSASAEVLPVIRETAARTNIDRYERFGADDASYG
jgi:hypothetical protein